MSIAWAVHEHEHLFLDMFSVGVPRGFLAVPRGFLARAVLCCFFNPEFGPLVPGYSYYVTHHSSFTQRSSSAQDAEMRRSSAQDAGELVGEVAAQWLMKNHALLAHNPFLFLEYVLGETPESRPDKEIYRIQLFS